MQKVRLQILAIFLAISVFMALPAMVQAGDDPSDTVQPFYQSIVKGDLKSLYSRVTPAVAEDMKSENFEKLMDLGDLLSIALAVNSKLAKARISDVTLNILDIQESLALVNASYTLILERNGMEPEQNNVIEDVVVEKFKGRWLVKEVKRISPVRPQEPEEEPVEEEQLQ